MAPYALSGRVGHISGYLLTETNHSTPRSASNGHCRGWWPVRMWADVCLAWIRSVFRSVVFQ